MLLPNLYYSPETRAGVGLAGAVMFRADSLCRTSSVDFGALYTQRKQAIIDITGNISLLKEQIFLKGVLHYAHFPDYFWGVGSNTRNEAREQVLTEYIRIHPQAFFRISRQWYAGPQYHYHGAYRIQFDSLSRFMSGDFPGFDQSCASGLGINVMYDSRDNLMFPRSGTYLEAGVIWYHPQLGSTHQFVSLRTDCRKYLPVGKLAVLAFQGVMHLHRGEVPFVQMAAIGGHSLGRGYYQGRFRDQHLLAFQAEYRQPFGHSRWGAVAFAGCATVANALCDFRTNAPKGNVGAGLRFRLSKQDPMNMRADMGVGRKTYGVYGNIGEAF